MAFTHVDIEERKSRRLILLFVSLGGLYVVSILALLWGTRLLLGFEVRLRWPTVIQAAGLAWGLAAVHWLSSTHRLMDRVLLAVRAQPLDPHDTYHARFRDIVEEVSIATGGRQIEPYVIPTPAMNACAVADFDGRSAIAVTEGLLARLDRSQLESVVGHEAAHVASGDSLSNSAFCGLFGLHEEALKRLTGLFSGRSGLDVLRGRSGALIGFVIVVLWVTTTAKRLCELLVSREQEYRADAVAVRLTRNPLGLAEALHLIERYWRGVGVEGESLGVIFILDTGLNGLSDQTGLFADLFSTHPPTDRRIELLLGMAHLSPDAFAREMTFRTKRPRPRHMLQVAAQDAAPPPASLPSWFLRANGQWLGPLSLHEIVRRPEFTPEAWVYQEDRHTTHPAYQDPALLEALRNRYRSVDAQHPSLGECPNCHMALQQTVYEGAPLTRCPACGGCYVGLQHMSRIFVREDYAFPESIQRLAKWTESVSNARRVARRYGTVSSNLMRYRSCPQCGGAVLRKFYTEEYLVEVEQCWGCGLTWLDKHELELLQCLYEARAPRDPSTPRDATF